MTPVFTSKRRACERASTCKGIAGAMLLLALVACGDDSNNMMGPDAAPMPDAMASDGGGDAVTPADAGSQDASSPDGATPDAYVPATSCTMGDAPTSCDGFELTGVMATGITRTGATIEWRLSRVATGYVEFGLTPDYGSRTMGEEGFDYQEHAQDLRMLEPGTTYHARVHGTDVGGISIVSDDFTFVTRMTVVEPPLGDFGSTVPVPDRVATPGTLGASPRNPDALYVSTSGSDSSDGRSEASAFRTLQHAGSVVSPGQTIYVKAGTYTQMATLNLPGTAAAPIVVEGYRTTPGDNPTIENFNHTTAMDPAVMPLFAGPDRAVDNGIEVRGTHYTIRNFQIRDYARGLSGSNTSDALIENIITDDNGDQYQPHSQGGYNGYGIRLGSSSLDIERTTINRCVSVNATGQGITLGGRNSSIENSAVYADDETTPEAGIDYYILIVGESVTARHNYVERVVDLFHGGHGIAIASESVQSRDVLIVDNTVRGFEGEAYLCRHARCGNALFLNNTIVDCDYGFIATQTSGGAIVRNGLALRSRYPVSLWNSAGNFLVENSRFVDSGSVLDISSYPTESATSTGIIFDNVEIMGAEALLNIGHYGSDIVFRNSTIDGVAAQATYYGSHDRSSFSIRGENNTVTNSADLFAGE